MLRHFYVTLISLRSQRVVVFLLLREQQPRHCGVTTELSCYCGVDRPCRVLLHHHYVRALPFNAKYGEKPSGADWSTGPDVTVLGSPEIVNNKFTEESE